jgi:Tfp pilus assembly pilus retraction ATPase PilT
LNIRTIPSARLLPSAKSTMTLLVSPQRLRSSLREDPDVVLIGEMRDLETIAAAITIAETGHLVFATLHTNSASQSIDRMVDVFPPHQQPQVRAQLGNMLQAICSQRLVPALSGGRIAAAEIWLPLRPCAILSAKARTTSWKRYPNRRRTWYAEHGPHFG